MDKEPTDTPVKSNSNKDKKRETDVIIKKDKFVHLHNHSEFSLLDGASRLKDMIGTAKKLGQPAIALTDHGVMYGVIKFYQEALKQNVKPIIGCEVYVAARSRFDKSAGKDDKPTHLTLLAANNTGYRNLMKLSSLGFIDGFYYKPRVDVEVLEKLNDGIIALSGCYSGVLADLLVAGKEKEAEETAKKFHNIYKGSFYIELQNQNLKGQEELNKALNSLAIKVGLPTVATNDSHYIRKEDAVAQDVLLCIQTGSILEEQKRLKFSTQEFYIKSAAEMTQVLGQYKDAIDNTLEIAQKCNVEIELGKTFLPKYKLKNDIPLEDYLEKLCYEKLGEKYPKVSDEVRKRLKYELDVIKKTGFAAYFLIVWDFVAFAKSQGIKVGPGRGSAAGSIVSYVLDITTIDPLEHGLLFERFLNPERISMPDIDIDFCYERRNEVINYVAKKYGEDKVAQIITFGTMAARAATRDAGRVFNIPYGTVDKLAKMIPEVLGITIEEALKTSAELKQAYETDEIFKKILDMAAQLEGLVRQDSIHAAGVVIAANELTDYTPIQKKGDSELVTQLPMEDIQKIGLLKMDFLGLRTLTVINNACESIKRNKGKEIDIEKASFDDEKTFDLLRKGETIGVFQLESSGMRSLLRDLKPTNFSDVIAILALYRPGPLGSGMVKDFVERKRGLQSIKYEHPTLEKILEETYGIIVYQEQVMKIASTMANFSLAEADILRKAMSKKEPEVLKKQREKFVYGATLNKIDKKIAGYIFDLVSHFAGYGFNKSHSTAYAAVSYQTAYLKTHYPTEFMTALLT
ncbi:MAG: DNA polymerase III subunit alpha, partial [Actinobacteria bacterium]